MNLNFIIILLTATVTLLLVNLLLRKAFLDYLDRAFPAVGN